MKKESSLKKLGKAVALSAGLLIGAENAEAGKIDEVHSRADDMFNELENAEVKKSAHESNKQSLLMKEQKNITPDNKKSGDMFEAMDELETLDKEYTAAQTEKEKDAIRQKIAKELLLSGKNGNILSKGGNSIRNMHSGGWVINAQSDGRIVTGSIVSVTGNEKSMFAFSLR